MALRHRTSSYYKIQLTHVKPYQEEQQQQKSKYWEIFTGKKVSQVGHLDFQRFSKNEYLNECHLQTPMFSEEPGSR